MFVDVMTFAVWIFDICDAIFKVVAESECRLNDPVSGVVYGTVEIIIVLLDKREAFMADDKIALVVNETNVTIFVVNRVFCECEHYLQDQL